MSNDASAEQIIGSGFLKNQTLHDSREGREQMGKAKEQTVAIVSVRCVAGKKVKTYLDRYDQASQVMIGKLLTHMRIISRFMNGILYA